MPTITLSMPKDLKKEMDENKEINWSEVARSAITKKLKEIKLFESILKDSNLNQKDALDLGYKINKSMHKKLK